MLRDNAKPLVLITAGVGITPALAMLEPALQSGRDIRFVHCARHGGVHAFREWVDAQCEQHATLQRFYCYSEPRAEDQTDAEGFINQRLLADWLPADRDLMPISSAPNPLWQRFDVSCWHSAYLSSSVITNSLARHRHWRPDTALMR